MSPTVLPQVASMALRAREITLADEAALQCFFVANPDYFHIVHGSAPQPDEARDEIQDSLPAGWSFTRKWKIGFFDARDELVAFSSIVSDLMVVGVWHIGLFMVATARQGSGIARQLHRALQDWAGQQGARWLRLVVVEDNLRARAFWSGCGYVLVRRRDDIEMGLLRHRVHIMVKPVVQAGLADYLELMPYDRSEPAEPVATTPPSGVAGAPGR
ncbi:GNAT family N-acetyltransferase [Pseudomonas sessilinigenes]|uniref:GNAT family N-acetyltransferase n=1 Tax=Pseudomonas sessilinigenes TaxID=658629 RepID=A0ABX8MJX0_9PSED|nr:GNAT family N-acetyltransferase [Pseudomonas sessilinigenes]AZC27037.1 Acetyltransferase, GNAT family [Pseudomonas sessilinigenes]QXH39008.1 GNAT family N-acetyltransferase [Pseudomonas sessilinigenes]